MKVYRVQVGEIHPCRFDANNSDVGYHVYHKLICGEYGAPIKSAFEEGAVYAAPTLEIAREWFERLSEEKVQDKEPKIIEIEFTGPAIRFVPHYGVAEYEIMDKDAAVNAGYQIEDEYPNQKVGIYLPLEEPEKIATYIYNQNEVNDVSFAEYTYTEMENGIEIGSHKEVDTEQCEIIVRVNQITNVRVIETPVKKEEEEDDWDDPRLDVVDEVRTPVETDGEKFVIFNEASREERIKTLRENLRARIAYRNRKNA